MLLLKITVSRALRAHKGDAERRAHSKKFLGRGVAAGPNGEKRAVLIGPRSDQCVDRSRRSGALCNAETAYTRIQNLGRVRIVVQ